METHAVVDPEKIHLQQIMQAEFSVRGSGGDVTHLHTHFSSVVGIDQPANAVVIRLTTTVRTTGAGQGELPARADFVQEYRFLVENLPDLLHTHGELQVLDRRLVTTLISISISTARGIVWAQTKGTFLEGFVLPVVNPAKLVLDQAVP